MKNHFNYYLALIIISSYSQIALASSCAAYFPDTIQGNTALSSIVFKDNGRVINDPNNVLTFQSRTDFTNPIHNTCNTSDCFITGTLAPPLTLPTFITSLVTNDVLLSSGSSTIGSGGNFNTNNVDQLILSGTAKVTFLPSSSDYVIRNALFTGNAEITFNAGEYWFDELEILEFTKIFINGPVTIWVNGQLNHFDIEGDAQINVGGAAKNLVFVSYRKIHLKNKANVHAVLYSTGTEVQTRDQSQLTGVISVSNQITLRGISTVTYEDISGVKVGSLCGITTPSIDHYEINHDGNGLTCSTEPVIIKACTDNLCNTLSTDAVTLDFQGNGTTISSPTFTGSTTVNFNHTVAETLTLSVANSTITPTNALVCNNGSIASCDMVFADTGFRFLVNGAVSNIPTQLSGKPSNTGYHSANLALQAIKTNTVSGACEAALTSNVVIELAAKCTNPITCAGQAVNVNGTNIATLDNAASLSYTNINFDFGTNITNSAGFTFTYPDAGRVQFYARYNIPVNGLPSGNFMSGTSNGFVVRPLGFYIDVVGNTAAQNATQGVFKKAGQAFTTTIKAMQWQSGDDTNNDAKPDSNALLSNNIATPNFGNELAAESVVISNSLVAPTGGNNPALNNNIFSNFIAGVGTKTNLSWNEVGILKFDANLTDNQYIGTSDVINTVPYVGRFIPDHLVQTVVTQGTLTGTCGAGSWAYSGQKDEATQLEGAISYVTAPTLRITAYNANGSTAGDITKNYTTTGGEGFMRLLNTGISVITPTNDLNQLGVDGINKTALTGTITTGSLTQISGGVQDYILAATDDFTYTHNANAEISFYQAEIPLAVASITDQDSVTASATTQAVPTGVEIRFGRTVLTNSFGPETANLSQSLSVEYSNNGNFVINTDDNCSSFDSAKVNLSTISLVPNGLDAVVSGLFVNGVDSTIALKATGAGNQGQIGVNYSTYPWLQYDWNKDGVLNNNPDAVATFGLFRGNDRVIYWREVNN